MNERLQELLDAVQRTASQVGGSAADAAYGMGKLAGINAAKYLRDHLVLCQTITISYECGIRYVVPSVIHPNNDDNVIVRFRVDKVYQNKYLSLYLDGDRKIHQRKLVLAPGEMEQIVIKKDWLNEHIKKILITLEDE